MSFPNTLYGPVRLAATPTQTHPLGSRLVFPDGRIFRYAKAGAVALDVAKVCQESVVVTGHDTGLVVAAAAIGATTVTVTNATTAITKDMYKGGYLFVNSAANPGAGQVCKIESHPAESTGSGTVVITLAQEDALRVALTAASTVGLRKNQFDSVLVAPTAVTGIPVGVSPHAVIASYYFWAQTRGTCAVLTNGTVIRGLTVTPSATTPGAVDVYPLNSVDGGGQAPVIGIVQTVGATTDYSLVFLTID